MSYIPTVWVTGDTVTAEKLNKLENGVENAERIVIASLTYTSGTYSCSMSVSDMISALTSGVQVFLQSGSSLQPATWWTKNTVYFTNIIAEPTNEHGISSCTVDTWKGSNSGGSDTWEYGEAYLQLQT